MGIGAGRSLDANLLYYMKLAENYQLPIFNDCKNRITAVHVGDNLHVQKFRRSMDLNKNVGIYAVERKSDIPRIVLGKIQEYFY